MRTVSRGFHRQRRDRVTGNLRMFAFEAKGQSNAFGLSLLNAVTQRLQDYVGNSDALAQDICSALTRDDPR